MVLKCVELPHQAEAHLERIIRYIGIPCAIWPGNPVAQGSQRGGKRFCTRFVKPNAKHLRVTHAHSLPRLQIVRESHSRSVLPSLPPCNRRLKSGPIVAGDNTGLEQAMLEQAIRLPGPGIAHLAI
jgi:hypothetical protein